MTSDAPLRVIHSHHELVSALNNCLDSDGAVATTLKTNERVIARITDGIYRQPGSALRELISNSFDADATRVVIKTDAPRFEKIVIEDDGHGMTPDALVHLLLNIGGSAKRTTKGEELGVTAKNDPLHSPGGRRLIGKIGIGLFSVAQLTHTFQIITKTKNDHFRTIATVGLRQYIDEPGPKQTGSETEFESGKVNVWREKASDVDTHGTTIILTSIRPQARNTLRSRDIWAAIDHNAPTSENDETQAIEPPRFHIGRVDQSGTILKRSGQEISSLPWSTEKDSPEKAFEKLVNAVWAEVEGSNPNPQLSRIFDNYLRMIWQIALAIPLPYVNGHPFDNELNGWANGYRLSNKPNGAAEIVPPKLGQSIRRQFGLNASSLTNSRFDVFIDDLKLSRPLRFRDLPSTSHALKDPLIFIGQCKEDFPKIAREISGGPLAFEAYLFWTPKVAPTEHSGSLIRIHESSGTLFDSTFMRYQVAELSRLRQITCEIFVTDGLDSALNIDRESFNNAHPHAVYITKWLHNALRQLATTQKRLASEVREQTRDETSNRTLASIKRVARETWRKEADDPATRPPEVEISNDGSKSVKGEAYVYSRNAVIPTPKTRASSRAKTKDALIEAKLAAIAQVLASFGLLDSISKKRQERLLRSIYKILIADQS